MGFSISSGCGSENPFIFRVKTLYLDLLPPTILLGLGLQVRLLEFEFGWGLRVVVLGVRGFKSRDWAERIG